MSLTIKSVSDALKHCRGDILDAARLLSCRPREIAGAIEVAPELQGLMAAIQEEKDANPQWETIDSKMQQKFIAAVEKRSVLYKLEALEEIRDIAMMDVGKSAEMMKSKLAACVKLLGTGPEEGASQDFGLFLRDLAQKYQESAPRIQRLRLQLDFDRGTSGAGQTDEPPALLDTVSNSSEAPQLEYQDAPERASEIPLRSRSRVPQSQI